MRVQAHKFFAAAVHLVADGKADHASLFRNNALRLGVHLAAFGFIEFNTRGDDQFVHGSTLEAGVVPGATAQELGGDLQVGGGAVAPEHRAKRRFHPDVVPVAVA